jgi:glycosyltransferase involved in cell wall biosynthesis
MRPVGDTDEEPSAAHRREAEIDVLVDLTPLDTASRKTGTGRYIHELGKALETLSPGERGDLRLRGLVALSGPNPTGALTYPGGAAAHDAEGELAWLSMRRRILPSTLRTIKPRLFHATYHLGTPRGSFVPRVVSCLDLIPHVLHADYLPGRWAYRWALRAADALRFHSARRVQAISQYTADDLMRLCKIPAAKIDIVYLGVDLERYRSMSVDEEAHAAGVRARYGLRAGQYVFYMGAADPRKNVDVLISAFARAGEPGLELAILGHLRPAHEEIFARAMAEAGNPPGVRMLGFVPEEELPSIIGGALAFVFCSTYEGFGAVPIEAMACGCPVITTGLTSMKETVGDAALIVPPRDVPATADAIRRIVRDGALRRDLGKAGQQRAQCFSWRNTALATIASYELALRAR